MRRNYRLSGILLLGLLGLSLLLVACGGDAATNAPPATTAATSSTAPATPAPAATAVNKGPELTATPVLLPTPVGGIPTATAVPPTATPAPTTAAPSPTVAPTAVPLTGLPGKLSIVGNDFNVYVSRFDGKPPKLLLGKAGITIGANQDGEIFRFPTWTRDGSKLAVWSINVKAGQLDTASVYVVSADGSDSYKVQDNEAVSPIYMGWSPDGNFLSMLVGSSGSNSLELRVVDTSKGAAGVKANGVRKITQGNPLYTSWSADSDGLVVHTKSGTNDILSLIKAKDTKSTLQALKFNGGTGQFRAPAWSADGGRLAFSTLTGQTNENLIVQAKDGTNQGTVDGTGLGAAFNWSPAGSKLAYSFQDSTKQGFYKGLSVSDVGGTDAPKSGKISATKLFDSSIIAFFWSPDGKKIAYLNTNDDESRILWNIYDLDAKKSTKLLEWYPNNDLIQILNYFDQYAQSDSVWSPDSKALVFSGWINSTISASGQATGPAQVYVVTTEGANAGKPQLIGPGALAFWTK